MRPSGSSPRRAAGALHHLLGELVEVATDRRQIRTMDPGRAAAGQAGIVTAVIFTFIQQPR
jgi:hypothetical protein